MIYFFLNSSKKTKNIFISILVDIQKDLPFAIHSQTALISQSLLTAQPASDASVKSQGRGRIPLGASGSLSSA